MLSWQKIIHSYLPLLIKTPYALKYDFSATYALYCVNLTRDCPNQPFEPDLTTNIVLLILPNAFILPKSLMTDLRLFEEAC